MLEETTAVAVSKEATAMEIIKKNMIWSVAAGLLPVPFIEVVAITAVEVKLIRELADHFNVEFQKDLAKSAVASLFASLGSVAVGKFIARSSFRVVPVIGPLVGAVSLSAMAAAFTYAVGRVFAVHFATGGTLLDFEVAKTREFFKKEFNVGLKEASRMKTAPAPAS